MEILRRFEETWDNPESSRTRQGTSFWMASSQALGSEGAWAGIPKPDRAEDHKCQSYLGLTERDLQEPVISRSTEAVSEAPLGMGTTVPGTSASRSFIGTDEETESRRS